MTQTVEKPQIKFETVHVSMIWYLMLTVWIGRIIVFGPDMKEGVWLGLIFEAAGTFFMATAAIQIYGIRKNTGALKNNTLLTRNVFRLTRNPMYHGIYLMDSYLWFLPSINVWQVTSWLVFTASIVYLCIMQEKETLSRWGKEAEEYYSRVPSFVFGWLRPKYFKQLFNK